jgi:uncharacterized protein (TIGR03435 family)
VNWENVSLRDVVRVAFGVKDYQISAPDWMNSTRFNIEAKLPPNTTKEQYGLMWQTLLKERFNLTVHREKKDLPAYALVVAKGGPKIKESVDEGGPAAPDGKQVSGGDSPGGPMARANAAAERALSGFDRGGSRAGGPMRGGMMMMRGGGHLEAKGIAISQFVDMLSRQLDRPVEDQTELKGKYDIKLDYMPDESTQGMGMKMGMPMPMARPDGGGEGKGPEASDNNGASLFTALQAQLGLKLEARKMPLDFVVVDHAEKVPTEN